MSTLGLGGDAVLTRWDNAPHHSELETYPHHKHTATRVWKCSETSLASILEIIEKKLTSTRTD
ncbi:MAG: toxin-antitoxin system TumE family protein [Candidatus Jordarchaeum sp.]|uniref:toxin-antitoxin system TumE family protein n=1 Tax=Candidatus Jordarchaeum sp. TaxID=2823881 RepID=UPI004049C386